MANKSAAELEFEKQRADKPLFYTRVRSIQEWLLNGKAVSDIMMNITQTWGIGKRQAERYIREARKLFIEQNKAQIKEKIAFHLSVRAKLYEIALKEKDIKSALAIMKDAAELEGLYVQKVEHSTKDNKPIPFALLVEVKKDEDESIDAQ